VKNPISIEPLKIELSEKYIKGNVSRGSYHFSVDGQKINFSVPLQTGG
jgi:N-acetylmuramoyl-L-alanine amidase CwlA